VLLRFTATFALISGLCIGSHLTPHKAISLILIQSHLLGWT
jgi:hypothetical protein